MCWHLILEEFGPELKYIKGENNVVANSLSRLDMNNNPDILNISEIYGYDDEDLPGSAYPIRYRGIAKSQKNDAKIQQELISHKYYTLDTFCGGDQNHRLIFRNINICLPTALHKKICIGIMRCSIIWERLAQSILSVNISTGKSFAQHSTTCVRSAQNTKNPKQLIRNMASCHPNRLKPIPGTRYE